MVNHVLDMGGWHNIRSPRDLLPFHKRSSFSDKVITPPGTSADLFTSFGARFIPSIRFV